MTNLELCQELRQALEEFQAATQANINKPLINALQAKVDDLVSQLEALDRKVA